MLIKLVYILDKEMKMEDQAKKTGEGGAGNPDTGNRETIPAPD
jgi:hypothetical protein